MECHQIRRVPVVDQRERYVGIVAQADLAWAGQQKEAAVRAVGGGVAGHRSAVALTGTAGWRNDQENAEKAQEARAAGRTARDL